VISNASLIWREDVRERLAGADWLSLKVDSTDESMWRRINQPHPDLELQQILKGIQLMAAAYQGELTTETMLLDGINEGVDAVTGVSDYLAQLNPDKAYLAVPIRPVAESGIRSPTEKMINRAFEIVRKKVPQIEYLIGYEGNAISSTGDLAEDILSITAVHPLREDAVRTLLATRGSEWGIVTALIRDGLLKETEYNGKRFYMRALRSSMKE
jgi:wyosine [tRNA(Phe)-imidazoG37] synthetase (radical SAM superfamily)